MKHEKNKRDNVTLSGPKPPFIPEIGKPYKTEYIKGKSINKTR